ncbi:unnamed protein product [Cyprideis torosa]|uniref:Uncharacterized protein n=1 Tax=Cyprideis torosa TaxID=163714 RepID=A0A7R8VZN6_9CRUS|nr:unnamed protein product [Cyprideis torosa]CAG0878780.1 unnamed protein product [Cyprideis torosa]
MTQYLLPLLGYLLGSVSAAVITCRLMGLPDPRSTGSKNPGATNVLRIGNKKAAAVTLLGDMLKGLLPTLIAVFLQTSPQVIALTALAAFLGHLYPVFFAFKGGKGVATAIGATFGLSFVSGLLVAATWLAMSAIFRISSLAALIAFAAAPAYLWLSKGIPAYTIAMSIISVFLFWRHTENIKRILSGAEPKIGDKKSTKP